MKQQLTTAFAIACLALAGLSQSATAEIPVTVNAGYGYWYFDRDLQGLDLDETGTPVVGLEWAFNDNWAAEILFADDETDLDNGPDVDVTTWQVGVLYYAGSYIGKPYRLRPYAAFGAGEIDLDGDDFDTVETTVNGGLGVRWMLGRRVGLRLESRAVHSLDESETDILTTAGLNIYLGKVDPDPVVREVADSDGDGVPDDRDRCPGTAPGTRVDADGCELPVTKVASIRMKVLFEFDKSEVREQYFDDLEELAEFLQRFSDLQVEVEGHTDSIGDESYNMDLSQRRAQAVVDVLVNNYGIARSRLQPEGYGESQPVATNDTAEGRAQNRRVMATLEVEYEQ